MSASMILLTALVAIATIHGWPEASAPAPAPFDVNKATEAEMVKRYFTVTPIYAGDPNTGPDGDYIETVNAKYMENDDGDYVFTPAAEAKIKKEVAHIMATYTKAEVDTFVHTGTLPKRRKQVAA